MQLLSLTKENYTMQHIMGYYDGKNMIADGEEYMVPANYASKSMLIPWDKLKLIIKDDGLMQYKLIAPAPRLHIKGILHKKDNKYMALGSDNANYILNIAAVTFFKWQCGDEVGLVINKDGGYEYGALEYITR